MKTNFNTLYENWVLGNKIEIPENEIFSLYKNYLNERTEEICGKCTPCRDGIIAIKKLIVKFENKKANSADLRYLKDLINNLRASRCAVGLDTGSNSEVIFDKYYNVFKNCVGDFND